MKRKFDIEDSIQETDLKVLASLDRIEQIQIEKHEQGGYFLSISVKGAGRKRFMATQRVRDEPRQFQDFDRLTTYLVDRFPVEILSFDFEKLARKKKTSQKGRGAGA